MKKEEPNRIVVENGVVKTILNDSTKSKGYLEIEEARRLLKEGVRKIYEMNHAL